MPILLLLLLLLLLLNYYYYYYYYYSTDGATIDAMLLLTSGPQTCGFSRIFAKVSRVGSVGFLGRGLGGWGVIGTQTPRTISPQEPFYSVFTVLS